MKRKYKYEMHLHTKEFGWCARVWSRDIVDIYHNLGYDGICITNHFFREGMDSLDGNTWEEKVDSYLLGYKNAKEYSKKYKNFKVLLGVELRLEKGAEDYLIYGVTKEVLYKMENIFRMSIEQCYEFVVENNLILIQAHPLREYLQMQDLNYLHGLEVFNGNKRHENYNEKVFQIAKENNKLMIAGSDFHEFGDEGSSAMIFEDKIKNSKALAKALRKKHGEIFVEEE